MRVVTLARKPVVAVATAVVEHGCGGLNIDASRIAGEGHGGGAKMSSSGTTIGRHKDRYDYGSGWVPGSPLGRWPSNLILQGEDVVADLGEQSGWQVDGVAVNRNRKGTDRFGHNTYGTTMLSDGQDQTHGGEGTAARYFKQVGIE